MDSKKRTKLIREIVVLGVVLLLVGLVGAFQFGWFGGSDEVPTSSGVLDTEFNLEAYERIQQRQDSFPALNLDGLGKDNPFAP